MKVRCTNNKDDEDFLTLNKLYEVNFENGTLYNLKNDKGESGFYFKKQFEVLNDGKTETKVAETKNKTFNAQNTTIDIAGINFSCKDTPCMFAFEKLRVINPERFAKEYCLQFGTGMNGVDFSKDVEEDKMEDVRVVRKLEDLDGLDNGMGLYIDSNLDVRVKNKNMLICYGNDLTGERKDNYLEALKSMGFKFEYKPLDKNEEKLEKILESVEDVEAKNNIRNIFKIQKEFFEELKEIMGVGK